MCSNSIPWKSGAEPARIVLLTNYQLIMLDKEPVTKLVLCSKCRKVLERYRPSGTNLIRHYQRHMKNEKEEKRKAGKNHECFIKSEKEDDNIFTK